MVANEKLLYCLEVLLHEGVHLNKKYILEYIGMKGLLPLRKSE